MIDTDKLKAAALAATPGPWELRQVDGLGSIAHSDGWVLESTYEQDLRDQAYIALANPAAILELIAKNEELERKLAESENAPWLSLAHSICADAGIAPGHIEHRLTELQGKLAEAERRQVPIATVFHDEYGGGQHIEFTTMVPKGELIRLYAAPPTHHADLLNVAVAVRDACHNAWVSSMENWRGDVDVRAIVDAIAAAPEKPL